MDRELTQREREILRQVIHSFILTANPVGSQYLAHKHGINLSSASIRNVMAKLEELGYLYHPHTSAGRIPTDKGYRFYIDSLMELDTLNQSEQEQIAESLNNALDSSDLLDEASHLLGKVSKQLSIVSSPNIADAILRKLELLKVSSSKVLVIISLDGGIVRTIVLEVESDVPESKLQNITSLLNERLTGLRLSEIRESIKERVAEYTDEEVVNRLAVLKDRIFAARPEADKLHIGMTQEIFTHPEYEQHENLKGIIEILEDENIIFHILETSEQDEPLSIRVGSENRESRLKDYSLITARYQFGAVKGTVGVVGPKRMQYSRLIPLVDFMAKLISNKLTS